MNQTHAEGECSGIRLTDTFNVVNAAFSLMALRLEKMGSYLCSTGKILKRMICHDRYPGTPRDPSTGACIGVNGLCVERIQAVTFGSAGTASVGLH